MTDLLTQFDQNQKPSLNSKYEIEGAAVSYAGQSVLIMVLSHEISRQSAGSRGNSRDRVEVIEFLIRRYGGLGVVSPQNGDRVVITDEGVEKTFELFMLPKTAFSALEWKLRIRRISNESKGSQQVVPFGGV